VPLLSDFPQAGYSSWLSLLNMLLWAIIYVSLCTVKYHEQELSLLRQTEALSGTASFMYNCFAQ
jgi:hypothetical protein